MQRVRLCVVAIALLGLCSCSLFGRGGSGAGDDALGEGNIPLARAGDILKDVNFAFDSSALDAVAKAKLQENAQWLLDNSRVNVEIEGHCDERGTAEYNLALGERRANSVKEYLRTLGVSADRMSTISYGEELPLDPASNEAAWAKNRRAHFAIK